uniref:Aa_trans domain-containing protein n=1 Tax=Enterobius vermicularis TaxID=51028 RepID=A0A0N4UTD9_ENTVE
LFTEIFLKNFLGTGDRRKEGVEDERREEDGVGKGETGGVLKRRNWRSKVLMCLVCTYILVVPRVSTNGMVITATAMATLCAF